MVGYHVVLVVTTRSKTPTTVLTQHEGVFGQTMDQLVVVQVAQPFEFFPTNFALK
jgi:hypothetical protein